MGKPIPRTINNFSYGMTIDPREPDTRYAQLIKGFDAHSYKHKLVPFHNSQDGDSAGNTNKIKNFAIALRTGTTQSLYGLGVMSGSSRAQVLYKDLTTGAANDLDDNLWVAASAGQSTYNIDFNLFVYYKKKGLIYGAQANAGTAYIWAFSPTGTSFDDTARTLTTAYTNMAGGLVHSKDNVLYIAYDNIIVSYNGSAWTDPALTLPNHLRITSICEYGNFLAIGCAPVSGFGKSIVYLWDRNSVVNDITESIDWGEGCLYVLEDLDGYLVGVSSLATGNIGGAAVATSNTTFNQRVVFRYYAGGKAIPFREFISADSTASLSVRLAKQKVNNYLYFLLAMTFPDGTLLEGVWKIGRNKDGAFSVVLDRGVNNDTNTTSGTIYSFIVVGDFVIIAYDSSGTHALSITMGSGYTATSIYETVILNEGDSAIVKEIKGVTVFTEPLPSGGQVVLKYKVDSETSFTTIFTNTTQNSVSYSATSVEATGVSLPSHKEITYRVESTGGAIITGIRDKIEILDNDNY